MVVVNGDWQLAERAFLVSFPSKIVAGCWMPEVETGGMHSLIHS
jgi:hypothetical protein